MKRAFTIICALLSIILQSCNQPQKEAMHEVPVNDTLEIKNLLINIYNWHDKQEIDYTLINNGKNLLGVDTTRLNNTLAEMKKTNFFSDTFLNNYLTVGQRIDHLIRKDTSQYEAGMINFPFQDYDTWHGGNGPPPEWAKMKLLNVHIDKQMASFTWICDSAYKEPYLVKFRRVNDKWKLDYLQDHDLKNYEP